MDQFQHPWSGPWVMRTPTPPFPEMRLRFELGNPAQLIRMHREMDMRRGRTKGMVVLNRLRSEKKSG
eukprot:scaffold19245_cov199-Amphora_coffeaeformis.AAC.17